MLFFPNAKVNLGLNVIAKRSDGFHDIETLFVPVPHLCDILEVLYSDTFKMELYGNPFEGDPMDNLCVKAYRLLQQKFDLPPVRINLFKNIPVGAGLGGGSADAAFTIVALNTLFKLGLSPEEQASYAARLGSDCAFFIYNRPMFACGRGEILTPFNISLEGYRIEVVPQDVFVSTKEAYAGIVPAVPPMRLDEVLKHPIEEWKELMVNDFEKTIFLGHPEIAAAKQQLYDRGALYAAMSGSGSSVFGLFKI